MEGVNRSKSLDELVGLTPKSRKTRLIIPAHLLAEDKGEYPVIVAHFGPSTAEELLTITQIQGLKRRHPPSDASP
jgi:hypothetical protein